MENQLKKLVQLQKEKKNIGIYSACSCNPFVIKAVLKRGKETNSCVLIESTANQCDQFGGYTGMLPSDFKNMVLSLAKELNFDTNKLFLGGDHLGPLTFAKYNQEKAMQLASELIDCYVSSGFTKIHIDTSMKLASDDPNSKLSDEIIAQRACKLARVANEAFKKLKEKDNDAVEPVYIIGSEVPTPGGQTLVTESVQVTSASDFKKSVDCFKKIFLENGLQDVWDNVIGFVVQPGIEENDFGCVDYVREKAVELSKSIDLYPNLVFEAHSTDYQQKEKLRELVMDGFVILKVGPALTNSLREGLFALSYIEDELVDNPSNFRNILEKEMLDNDKYWIKHYQGTEKELQLKRKYSFSDRCRYYLSNENVEKAINTMLDNVRNDIPLGLIKQFMPIQYQKIRKGLLRNNAEDLLIDKVCETIDDYLYASKQEELF